MELTRREFGGLVASSLLFITLFSDDAVADPIFRRAGSPIHEMHPIITTELRGGLPIARVATRKHHVVATKATSLSDGFTNMNFGAWRAGMPRVCPSGGQMSVFLDTNGNWSFGGSFPSQSSAVDCTVALAIGLRSSTGQVVAFTDSGTVTSEGWTFNKQGNNSTLRTMWPSFVNGHDFKGSWLAHQIPRANHQSGQSSGSGADIGDVLATITDVLGVASLIL